MVHSPVLGFCGISVVTVVLPLPSWLEESRSHTILHDEHTILRRQHGLDAGGGDQRVTGG
jgi:hypothetical protein